MHDKIQLRWIEQAEARTVRAYARLHRARSEPYTTITYTDGGTWLDWLGKLARPLRRQVALEGIPTVDNITCPKARSHTAARFSAADMDYDRVLVAVLMTDIVDSTKRVAEIGDRDWRMLLDRHDDMTRRWIKQFGGWEAGNRGDGFVGIFDSPARAVRCAVAIADTIASLGILVRSGIHVGEVHVNSEQISGMAVNVAARIATMACPGEAFVSKIVCDLVTGSGLIFEDRGIHHLRGLPEEFHLYSVSRPLLGKG
jgi:class 3 adenylate cyclase